ncbi:MAG: hypothetical protein SVY53_12365 [Chloroflexota bacterium]|nr:hypothetical protein [Chloroflexota bacterium]
MIAELRRLRLAISPLVILALMLALLFQCFIATSAFASTGLSVNAWHLPGSSNAGKTPAELDNIYADPGTTWLGYKLEGADLATGTYTNGTITVTITNMVMNEGEPIAFDWTSNIGIDAIVVKDGNAGANFYVYDGLTSPTDGATDTSLGSWRDSEETNDTGLTTPIDNQTLKAISHITFCYDIEQTPQTGTIIVEKQTDPDGAPDSFTYSGDVAGVIKDGEQIVVSGLQPGTYTSTELVPAGWSLTSITCDDSNSSGDLNTSTVTFQLEAGETVKATFTNTKELPQTGTIIIEKQTNPDGAPDSFTYSGDVAGVIKDGEQIVVSGLQPGTYTSTELVPAGWSLTSITCDDSNSSGDLNTSTVTFQLEAGETVKATFVNTKDSTQIPSTSWWATIAMIITLGTVSTLLLLRRKDYLTRQV